MPDTAALDKLAACPLFVGLDQDALAQLLALCEPINVRSGERVIVEGTEGDSMYIIQRGRVRVEKLTLYQDAFTVTFLQDEKGDFFGELALLSTDQRSATVVAESECEFMTLSRDKFTAFGDKFPAAGLAITRRIAQNLASRLRRANEDVITLFSALVEEVEQRI